MRKKNIILLIVLLSLGFAAISTTLVINGNLGIKTNQDNFIDGLVFDKDSLRSSDNSKVAISASGRTISFTIQIMMNAGDEATVYFKIKNYSQYNATLGTPAISCYFVDNHEADKKAIPTGTTYEYVELIPGRELDGDTINGGGNLSGESRVTVRQIKSYTGDASEVKFQCEINATAYDGVTQSIGNSKSYVLADTNNNGVADIGEEIRVGTDSFYVISNTANEINALAKYNLKVGGIYNGATKEKTFQVNEEGYGRQDSEMRGYVEGEKRTGTLRFSKIKGWDNSIQTIDIRNEAYRVGEGVTAATMTALDALYGTYGYEAYIQSIIFDASIRLIKKEEIEALVNNGNELGHENIKDKIDNKEYYWLYSTSYWTQSTNGNIWGLSTYGNFYNYGYSNNNSYGVRPVITIPIS